MTLLRFYDIFFWPDKSIHPLASTTTIPLKNKKHCCIHAVADYCTFYYFHILENLARPLLEVGMVWMVYP